MNYQELLESITAYTTQLVNEKFPPLEKGTISLLVYKNRLEEKSRYSDELADKIDKKIKELLVDFDGDITQYELKSDVTKIFAKSLF